MDKPALLLKLVHVSVAIAFIAGLIGRWIVLRRAARATDINEAFEFSEAAAPFERLVIIGSSAAVFAGLATAGAQGHEWLGLRAAFADPAVAPARNYKILVVAIVVALMVLKPF